MQCYYFEECGNEAVYELEAVEGEIIHVCEDCDECYTLCNICGKVDFPENMTRLNPEDEYKTCYKCEQNHLDELREEVNDKIADDHEKYKNKELQASKESLFNASYRNAIAGEWLYFFDNYFEGAYDDELAVLKWLLSLRNIIESFTQYAFDRDIVEFTTEWFCDTFEEYKNCHVEV